MNEPTVVRIHDEDQVVESTAQAARDAVDDAAPPAGNTIGETGIIPSVSRLTYNGAYAISFGIVYGAVFVTQFLPQDNPVMRGFSDGAQAARDSLSARPGSHGT
jgi:hypothetical protein